MELQLSGRVVPKARPRMARGKVPFLPKPYKLWKEDAIHQLQLQLPWAFRTIETASIEIEIFGQARGDLDNLAGAVLDALVQARVIHDDRVNCVPRLLITFTPGPESGANIKIMREILPNESLTSKTSTKKTTVANCRTKNNAQRPVDLCP